MPGRHPPYVVDLDRLERLLIVLSILGFAMAGVGLLGEHLGWWNDTGELLISFGTVVGVATGVVALLVNSTKGQVRRVADGVEANGDQLGTANRSLDTANGKLDTMSGKLDTANEKLDTANGKLDTVSGKLDTANGKLDALVEGQTRQTDILVEIRDRL